MSNNSQNKKHKSRYASKKNTCKSQKDQDMPVKNKENRVQVNLKKG